MIYKEERTHCLSNSWPCCRRTTCKLRKLCFIKSLAKYKSCSRLTAVLVWKEVLSASLFWERTLEISFSYWQIKISYDRNKKWDLQCGTTSDARIWSSMKVKGLLMRVSYSFLFNSVHLWTVPLSFTLFMADYTH